MCAFPARKAEVCWTNLVFRWEKGLFYKEYWYFNRR